MAITFESYKGIGIRKDFGNITQSFRCNTAIGAITPGNDGAIALKGGKSTIT